MSKLILGIHGLGNKAPKEVLEKWWLEAILEGLKRSRHPRPLLKFKLIYWADLLYEEPLDPGETDEDDPLYLANPYVPAIEHEHKDTHEGLSSRILGFIEKQAERVYLNRDAPANYSALIDLFIRYFFKDLDTYYTKSCLGEENLHRPAKVVIRDLLARALRDHRRKDTMLIAHSMGSIIAFDTLTYATPDIKIDTFVTIGSPLGLPAVMSKILTEQGLDYKDDLMIQTPENLRRVWYNFFDPEDRVSMKCKLKGDYAGNSRKVAPIDQAVINDYEYNGRSNPHQAFGYLRTQQVARAITEFLDHGKPRVWIWFSNIINKRIQKAYERKAKREGTAKA